MAIDVQLREVREEDLPIFYAHQCEPAAHRMAVFPPREKEPFIQHWLKILGNAAVTAQAVIADGQLAGNVGSWDQGGRRLVCYWIGQAYWGRGIATKALSALLQIERRRPIFAHVATTNAASIRVLEKCGFRICSESTAADERPSDGVEEYIFELRNDAIDVER